MWKRREGAGLEGQNIGKNHPLERERPILLRDILKMRGLRQVDWK